jgi:hypothetical protein
MSIELGQDHYKWRANPISKLAGVAAALSVAGSLLSPDPSAKQTLATGALVLSGFSGALLKIDTTPPKSPKK